MDEHEKILEMLAQGHISADEAADLLAALEEPQTLPTAAPIPVLQPDEPQARPDGGRQWWLVSFSIGGTLFFLAVVGMWQLWSAPGWAWLLTGLVCLWPMALLALLLMALSLVTRATTWLNVDVRQKNGRHVRFSLPLPLPIVRRVLDFAYWRANGVEKERLAAVRDVMAHLDHGLPHPIILNARDEDGDVVELSIG